MTSQEVVEQEKRIKRYRELAYARAEIGKIEHRLTSGREEGSCKQGPHTGNTREARTVVDIRISFSATNGGAPAVEERLDLSALGLRAWELADWLRTKITSRINAIDEELKAL